MKIEEQGPYAGIDRKIGTLEGHQPISINILGPDTNLYIRGLNT